MSRIQIPGQSPVDMNSIQQQAMMRTAMIERMITDTGSRIFSNLASAYYLSLQTGEQVNIDRLRQLATVAKEMSPFFPEALGLVNCQPQSKPEGAE